MIGRSCKRQRLVRASGGRLEMTPRDREVLVFLGLVGYASITQIATEFFPGLDRARRRCRQLFDAGLVSATLVSSSQPNLFGLTRAGLRLATSSAPPEIANRLRLAGPIRLAGVSHHLAVVDARTYCSALAARRGDVLLRWSNASGGLARELGLEALEPDGIAEVASGSDRLHLAVEVDLGSEPVSSVLAAKLERYGHAALAGQLDALWIVVVGGERRLAAIDELVRRSRLEEFARVLPHELVIARPVHEPPARGGSRAASPNTPSARNQVHVALRGV